MHLYNKSQHFAWKGSSRISNIYSNFQKGTEFEGEKKKEKEQLEMATW